MKTLRYLVLILAVAICLLITNGYSIAQQPSPVPTQGSPTSSSPTSQPPAISSTLTYEEVLTLYGNFSTEIAKSSQNTINLATAIFIALLGLGAIVTAIVAYIATQVHSANSAANKSEAAANKAAIEATESRNKLELLQSQIKQSTEELHQAKNDLDALSREIKNMLPEDINQIEIIASIDRYELKLFSTDEDERNMALETLIEFSKDENPVIKSKCIDIFRTVFEYPLPDVDTQPVKERVIALISDSNLSVGNKAKYTFDKVIKVH